LVGGLLGLALAVAITNHAPRHEQVDVYEDDTGDPEGDVDGLIHRRPVRGDLREPPGVAKDAVQRGEVERQSCNYQQDQCPGKYHSPALPAPVVASASACGQLVEPNYTSASDSMIGLHAFFSVPAAPAPSFSRETLLNGLMKWESMAT